jgi:coenzyme F420-reducing hydrogenase gamma subunit
VTRAGCNAICPTFGDACEGCRGLLPDGNFGAHQQLLTEHGNSTEDVRLRYLLFNSFVCEELGVTLP